MRHAILVVACVFSVGGCASDLEQRASGDPHADCRREYKVGSNIAVLNCETPKSGAERQQKTEGSENSVRPVPQRASTGTGG
jgi:hypothetical protein